MNNQDGKRAFYDYHIYFSISGRVERLEYEYKKVKEFIREINALFLLPRDFLIV